MNVNDMRYQVGQQFLIRVTDHTPAFRVRIDKIDTSRMEYFVHRIGHQQKQWISQSDLDDYIRAVDD